MTTFELPNLSLSKELTFIESKENEYISGIKYGLTKLDSLDELNGPVLIYNSNLCSLLEPNHRESIVPGSENGGYTQEIKLVSREVITDIRGYISPDQKYYKALEIKIFDYFNRSVRFEIIGDIRDSIITDWMIGNEISPGSYDGVGVLIHMEIAQEKIEGHSHKLITALKGVFDSDDIVNIFKGGDIAEEGKRKSMAMGIFKEPVQNKVSVEKTQKSNILINRISTWELLLLLFIIFVIVVNFIKNNNNEKPDIDPSI